MTGSRTIEGKTALVTGANRGLGAALVAELVARGAAKVYCGARDVASFGDQLAKFGSRAHPVRLDVTSDEDVASAAATLTDVDIVVSNAGVTYMVPLMETTIEGARNVMDTNYFGPLRLVKGFGPALNERHGGFISILSLAGLVPAGDAELYSASKAASSMLGHATRRALPDVAVSMSYPGLMDTDMMSGSAFAKTSAAEIAARTLDGWCSGKNSIFPDLHSELLRDEILARAPELLNDPYALMNDALAKYLALRPGAAAA